MQCVANAELENLPPPVQLRANLRLTPGDNDALPIRIVHHRDVNSGRCMAYILGYYLRSSGQRPPWNASTLVPPMDLDRWNGYTPPQEQNDFVRSTVFA